MKLLQARLAHHLYPLFLLLGLLAMALVLGLAAPAAVPVALATTATTLGVLALALAAWLERSHPYRKDWRQPRPGETATDLWSALVMAAVVDPLLKAVMPVLGLALATAFATATAAALAPALPGLWPAAASLHTPEASSLALQFLAAWLWMELANYGMHRAHHAWAPLWALHALHHNPKRLYWLNGLRFHPLNHALNTAVSALPLLMLGFSELALLLVAAMTTPLLMLQHANVATRSGWLNALISTNEVHRWHHATTAKDATCNFGSTLLLWDHVFGTYRAPAANVSQDVGAVGLFPHSQMPALSGSYGRQMLLSLGLMLGPRCCGIRRG